MNLSKKQKIYAVISIAILLVALAFMIVNFVSFPKFLTHPILNFLLILCVGFGIMCIILGVSKKSPWYFFLSAILLGLSLLYVLLNVLEAWWIAVVCVAVLLIIAALFSFISAGNKTEAIALNKSPDYKDYKQRKAEKEAAEAAKEPEELPEIKSFK